jgi:hypothetical protein
MEMVVKDVAVRSGVQGVPSRKTVRAQYEVDAATDDADVDDGDDSDDDTDDIMRGSAYVAQRQHLREFKQSSVTMNRAMRTLRTFRTGYRHVVVTDIVAGLMLRCCWTLPFLSLLVAMGVAKL